MANALFGVNPAIPSALVFPALNSRRFRQTTTREWIRSPCDFHFHHYRRHARARCHLLVAAGATHALPAPAHPARYFHGRSDDHTDLFDRFANLPDWVGPLASEVRRVRSVHLAFYRTRPLRRGRPWISSDFGGSENRQG